MGVVEFRYLIRDSNVPSVDVPATVYITMTAPLNVVAVNNTYIAPYNQAYSPPLSQLILGNDFSPSANPQLQVVSIGTPPNGGTITNYTSAGSFVFTPEPGFVGALAGGVQACVSCETAVCVLGLAVQLGQVGACLR